MLSEEEFKSLASLARLNPEDESLQGLRDDFNKILGYVETIQGLNLADSADYYTAIDTRNVLREDEPAKGLGSEAISKVAPDWETGHFVVPRVIDSE